MTHEEKQLLLQDLSARLPYGVKVCVQSSNPWILRGIFEGEHSGIMAILLPLFPSKTVFPPTSNFAIDRIKPYLRPLSSMTEDEAYYIARLLHFTDGEIIEVEITDEGIWIFIDDGVFSFEKEFIYFSEIVSSLKTFDYLNASHFDIRGLIPKDLAIEAPNNMYKIE